MLLDERTHVEAPSEPPQPRACANCGADLADVQEWCLECGQRQPRRRRWTAGIAALVVGGVIALAGGGSALSYVALRDDANDQSSKILAQAPGPAAAVPGGGETGAATGGTPGAPPTSTTPSTTTNPQSTASKAPPLIHVQIHPGATPPPPAISAPGSTGTTSGTTTPGTGTTKTTTPKRVKTVPKRPKDSDQRYAAGYSPTNAVDFDPLGDGHEHPTEVRNAIDRNLRTSWTTNPYPQGLPHPLGLFVDAGSQVSLRAMEIATSTPGYAVSIYGSASYPSGAPGQSGTGWQLVASGSVGSSQSAIGLGGQGTAKFEYYLVWITSLPAGSDRATISEITLLGTDTSSSSTTTTP